MDFTTIYNAIDAYLTHEHIMNGLSLAMFVWLFWTIHNRFIRSPKHKNVEWYDVVMMEDHISLTKVLNLTGGLIGSWVVVKMTIEDKLTWDIFVIYLMYCASTEAFSKFVAAKYKK